MAISGSLNFAPVLHNITPERVVFVYNDQKEGSLEVAEYYQSARSLPTSNLISISITPPSSQNSSSECESVVSYDEYIDYIETPVLAKIRRLNADSSSAGMSTSGAGGIWVIILGYGIPLAFETEDGEIIAIASYFHRLGKSEFTSPKSKNHTYDRRASFDYFDETDASKLFITAVLDGPTVKSVKTLIDRSLDVDNQTFVAGMVYVDPYGLKSNSSEMEYQDVLLDFVEKEVPNLGLDSLVTVGMEDPYFEPTVKSLEHDSFYWGWFNPTYSKQLFLNQNERRVFLYNADYSSACGIHFYNSSEESVFDTDGSDNWCNLAINVQSGYASCAGSVDQCEPDTFLSPRPFFETLHHGATLGEAFLFASKYVGWKTVLIGDPLMVVNFPVDSPPSQDPSFSELPNNEVLLRVKRSIEESLGWSMRQYKLLSNLVDYVVDGHILKETVALLQPMTNWKSLKNTNSQTSLYYALVSAWLQYLQKTTLLNLSQWLEQNEIKVSQRFNEVVLETGAIIADDDQIYDEGYWDFTFQYIHSDLTLQNIHFSLQVATDEDFNNIIYSFSTLDSVENWKYEYEPFEFINLPDTGFPSNFSRRRISFTSPSLYYLIQNEIYYIRWQAIDEDSVSINDYTVERIVIWA